MTSIVPPLPPFLNQQVMGKSVSKRGPRNELEDLEVDGVWSTVMGVKVRGGP